MPPATSTTSTCCASSSRILQASPMSRIHVHVQYRLLEKFCRLAGVHSAVHHDVIMQSSHPDYMLVEGEAERVARDAARALRKSRAACHSAASGKPTWTGSSGVLAKSVNFNTIHNILNLTFGIYFLQASLWSKEKQCLTKYVSSKD